MREKAKTEFTSPFFKVGRSHEGRRRAAGIKEPLAASGWYFCDGCSKIYGQGDMTAVANDMVDGSISYVFICRACWLEKTRPEIRREGCGLSC